MIDSKLFAKIILMVVIPFTFVALVIPFIKKIAVQIGAVDMPGGRHIHKKPTPKLGGLGIFLGYLLGYMIFGEPSAQMNSILIGSFIILITGIIDDIVELKPSIKFAGQLMAALVIAIYGGILLKDVSAFGIYLDFGIMSYPLTIFFILGCVNCINLIDGLDGLSGGISSIYYLTIGIIATMQGKHGLDFVLAFVMLGSTLGFLVHNFNPAKIFAGDSGSNFMGFIIAVIALLGFKNVTMASLIVPLLLSLLIPAVLLVLPIMDTLFAIIRRFLKGESISKGDSYHIHHQLLRRNLSVKQTVLIIYLVDILFASASIIYILKDKYLGYIIYGILLALVIVFVINTNVIYDFKDSSKEKKHE